MPDQLALLRALVCGHAKVPYVLFGERINSPEIIIA